MEFSNLNLENSNQTAPGCKIKPPSVERAKAYIIWDDIK